MGKFNRLVAVFVVIIMIGGGYLHTINSSASVTSGNDATKVDRQAKQDYKRHDGYHHRYMERHKSKRFHHWRYNYRSNYFGNKTDVNKGENNQSNKNNKEENNQANGNTNQQNNQQNKPAENQTSKEANDLGNVSEFEKRVIDLTNKERAAYGLKPLQADYELGRVAKEKSRDMLNYQYFAHNSPVYGSPFDMMDAYQVKYRTAGENIAKGQRSPEEVVNAWMNSEGHRANILNGSFTHIGVGFVENGNIWTQQFIGK